MKTLIFVNCEPDLMSDDELDATIDLIESSCEKIDILFDKFYSECIEERERRESAMNEILTRRDSNDL